MFNTKRRRNKSAMQKSKNMSNTRKSKNTPAIRIEVHAGDYDTDNAYNNVLGYISNKTYIGGYGFSCNPGPSVIEQFRLSETCSHFSQPQKIWHFFITFSQRWNHNDLLQTAVSVADSYFPGYQVLFGLDEEGMNLHLHFGVNAYSYHPDRPVLSAEKMEFYIKELQQSLSWDYSCDVALQFQEKRCRHVRAV